MSHQYPAHSTSQVIQRLPAHARRKWYALLAQADDSEALLRVGHERVKTLAERRDHIERRLSYLDRATESAEIAAEREELDVIDAELSRLAADRDRRERTRENVQQVISQVRDIFLPTLGLDLAGADGRQMAAANVEAKPRKNESLLDALERVRNEIGTMKSELQQVKSAPPSRREIEAALRTEVQMLIHRGTPSVNIADGKITVYWPDQPMGGVKNAASAAPSGSASALIAALFPDQMFKMLMQGVDEIENGIAAPIRRTRIAEIEAKVLHLEHVEEAFVMDAIAAGLEVYRRTSASGWALLGISPPQAAVEMIAAE